MNLVTAFIKPVKLDEVKDALAGVGIRGMTVTESRGFGRTGEHTEVYRGSEYTVEFIPVVRIEVLTEDDIVEDVVETISSSARTGRVGDGRIWVTLTSDVYRIRTGEAGDDAI